MTCFFFHNLHISWAQKNKQTTKPIHYNRFIIGELVSREQIGAATFLLKRRRKYYYYNEYPFVLDRRRNQNEYYHCAQNVASDCKARLVIKNVPDTNAQITSIKQHNHTDKGGMYEILKEIEIYSVWEICLIWEKMIEYPTNFSTFLISVSTGEKEDRQVVEHKGYIFVRHYEAADKTFWRCNHVVKSKRCTARLTTCGRNISERGTHIHQPWK